MGCATLETTTEAGERISAIVCGGRAIKACVGCGRLATLLCDFKVVHRGVSRRSGQPWVRHGTCSAPICAACTTKLPGDKDACPEHREVCLEACRRRGLAVPA